MAFWHSNLARLILLVTACAFLSSLELLAPLFSYRRGRIRRAIPNLMLAAGVVLLNVSFASALAWLSAAVTHRHFGLFSTSHAPTWVVFLFGVAGLDFLAYLAHLLLHKSAWGWRFHRVHHSEMEVDVTTAFRQHPGETLWRTMWLGLGIAIFGLPFWVIPVYLSLSSLNALAEHANVRMSEPIDAWLRLLVVTPNMHKIHHSRRIAETDSNYSNIFSVWDRLCGTHTSTTDYRSLRYGLHGFEDAGRHTLAGLVREPFRTN